MRMASRLVPAELVLTLSMPIARSKRRSSNATRVSMRPPLCSPASVQQLSNAEEDIGEIMCSPCGDKGWILCDFCNGQKTNVKSPSNRIYRRCPTCKAVGCVLCANCKVFKCVTFPNYDDAANSNM